MTAVAHMMHRLFTGATFGRRGSAAYARVYLKSHLAKADDVIREVWARRGYRPDEHGAVVWRVEFEARAELLRSLVTADGVRLPIDDPEALLTDHLGEVWTYLARDWLALREAGGSARLTRQPVRAWWAALAGQTAIDGQAGTMAARVKRQAPAPTDSHCLLQQAVGVLVALAATNGVVSRDATVAALGKYVMDTCSQDAFEALVSKRSGGRTGRPAR